MEKIRAVIDKIIEVFCIGIMGLMTVLVSWQVFTRYVLNKPSAISEVLTKYLFVWLVLYCSAYVFGKREHMSITYFRDHLPEKIKTLLAIIGEVVIFIFAALVLVKGGWIATSTQMVQLDSALQIPMGLIYSAMPISGVCTLFYCISNIAMLVSEMKN